MSVRICCVKPVVEFLLYGIAVVGEFKDAQLEDPTPRRIIMQVLRSKRFRKCRLNQSAQRKCGGCN